MSEPLLKQRKACTPCSAKSEDDDVARILVELLENIEEIPKEFDFKKKMVLSDEDRRNSKQATHFLIFKTSFDNDKVRDHCRYTKPRLKKHIELNTKLQENTKNEFETEFFKSMSNSFVENTMENIRNCVDVWLVSNRKRTLKLSAKPNLKHLKIFDEKLATI